MPERSKPGSIEYLTPEVLTLDARFAGTESFQPAETARRLPRTARVTLNLVRRPEPSDPESGIALDLAVGSSRGAVDSGSVEARLAGETVGIAAVEHGTARLLARFARKPVKTVELSLHYLPREPWWTPPRPLRVEAPLAASRLHQAGVRFAFQSGGLKQPRQYRENAIKAIKAGLPKEVALRAMTLTPAEIFGVSEQLGSIEVGKIANLVVTTGDLFEEATRVRYVFVDGQRFEVAEREAPRPADGKVERMVTGWTALS